MKGLIFNQRPGACGLNANVGTQHWLHSISTSISDSSLALIYEHSATVHRDQLMDSNVMGCLGPCDLLHSAEDFRLNYWSLIWRLQVRGFMTGFLSGLLNFPKAKLQPFCWRLGDLFLKSRNQIRYCIWACQSLKWREWNHIFSLHYCRTRFCFMPYSNRKHSVLFSVRNKQKPVISEHLTTCNTTVPQG